MTTALLAATTVAVLAAALRPYAPARGIGDIVRPYKRRGRGPRPARPARSKVPATIELATWCDALARSLRAGNTLSHAIRTTQAPPVLHAAVETVATALDRGATLTAALAGLPSGHSDLDLIVVVLRTCAEHGGGAAEPIDRAAVSLRQRAALQAERRTQSAQAQSSATVMTLLPIVLLLVLLTTSSSVREVVPTVPGIAALVAGGFANACGWLWMHHTIARAAR